MLAVLRGEEAAISSTHSAFYHFELRILWFSVSRMKSFLHYRHLFYQACSIAILSNVVGQSHIALTHKTLKVVISFYIWVQKVSVAGFV